MTLMPQSINQSLGVSICQNFGYALLYLLWYYVRVERYKKKKKNELFRNIINMKIVNSFFVVVIVIIYIYFF